MRLRRGCLRKTPARARAGEMKAEIALGPSTGSMCRLVDFHCCGEHFHVPNMVNPNFLGSKGPVLSVLHW